MRKIILIPLVLTLLISCKDGSKILIDQGKTYWGEYHAGDTTTIQTEYKIYLSLSDTLIHNTNYYTTGALKSKVVMSNELLKDIIIVKDTSGNDLDYGFLENGSGHVIQYSSYSGVKEEEGDYINGNKEGWWIDYHHKGYRLDSTFYKGGYPQHPHSDDEISDFLDMVFGNLKNNLYR